MERHFLGISTMVHGRFGTRSGHEYFPDESGTIGWTACRYRRRRGAAGDTRSQVCHMPTTKKMEKLNVQQLHMQRHLTM